MIVDVELNQLKKLGMSGSGFLLYEGETTFELYYANQGPIVFRTIVKKDDKALAFLSSIKVSVRLLTPLRDLDMNELKNIRKLVERMELILRTRRP